MFLVVGLGNPGARYARTRHNVGFLVVDTLADRWGARFDRNQLGAEVASARLPAKGAHPEVAAVLAKPQSFMNLSGQPVVSLRGWYKVAPADVVVVHDEVDLPFGDIRVKVGGGAGGHNGLRDLLAKLGDPGFVRVRFGVGRPPEGWDTADYVLSKWTSDEEAALGAGLLVEAAEAVENVVRLGAQAAMNHHNTKGKARNPSARPASGAKPPATPES